MTPSKKLDEGALGRHFNHEEAAVFETFIVPHYLSLFAERLLTMLAAGSDARVCHVHCRTGYPDAALLEHLPNAHVHGCDASEHAIELARAKASALIQGESGVVFDYRVVDSFPLPFPSGAFSHAFSLHPPSRNESLFRELARIVAPHGQALVAMPLRGSFVEVADLVREFAVKYERSDIMTLVDAVEKERPTDDMLKYELEHAGFEFVGVDVRRRTLRFVNGRDFFEDPMTRLLLQPEFRLSLGGKDMPDDRSKADPFAYVRDAIDKYWSDGTFELTVMVGVVSGRRKGTAGK